MGFFLYILCLRCSEPLTQTAINPIALRKAKIVYNFGLSECKRVKNPIALRKAKIVYNFCLSECKRVKNPIALRMAKIVYNFGLSECKRVKTTGCTLLYFVCCTIFKHCLYFTSSICKIL